MKVNFFIDTEQHARTFSPIIKSVGDYSIYARNAERSDAISRVLSLNEIDSQTTKRWLNAIK